MCYCVAGNVPGCVSVILYMSVGGKCMYMCVYIYVCMSACNIYMGRGWGVYV